MDGNLDTYRSSLAEQLRADDILQLLPRGRKTILEIGARDGYHTRKLTEIFDTVTALDLSKPRIEIPRVTTVEGDVTHLSFPDRSFDCVLCAEVLEHLPDLERAAREIARVARHEVLIGVPYKQDRRVGRLTCTSCGKINPPFGHVNTFDEQNVKKLFCDFEATATHFVGISREQTNVVSTLLLDLAGNPWGTYEQDERCLHCGRVMQSPSARSLPQKVATRLAHILNRFQEPFVRDRANWIHLLFRRAR